MTSHLRVRKTLTKKPAHSVMGHWVIGSAVALMMGGAALPVQAQDATAEYAALLREIDNAKMNLARKEVLIESQKEEIADLRGKIQQVPEVAAALAPMLTKFSAQLEAEMDKDVPFSQGERYERLQRMRETIKDPNSKLAAKFSRVMQVVNIETNYGYELSAYESSHPTDPGRRFRACQESVESAACVLSKDMVQDMQGGATLSDIESRINDGFYVRYGRMSLAYVDTGTSDVMVYDPNGEGDTKWRAARGSEVTGISRNLRVARGEAAPDVLTAPVVKSN